MTTIAPTGSTSRPSVAVAAGEPGVAPPLVVGFDLDMTLVDSRAGIAACYRALAAETGTPIDVDLVSARLGPPLEVELANWFPAVAVPAAAARFRAMYADVAVPATVAMPGAAAAVDAVHAAGGKAIVVSAKTEGAVHATIERVGLRVDAAYGDRFATGKAAVLAATGARFYVGDYVADVEAARAAGVTAVAVATGFQPAAMLAAAGADIVLPDLAGFPDWLGDRVLGQRLADLERRLTALGSVLVAFSGGADSAFVLAAAVRALGPDRVVAATAVSPSLPAAELEPAAAFARSLGVRHLMPRTDELARDGYRANAGNRCYFCKAELLDVLTPIAGELGIAAIATGTNADDVLAGFRPGIRAAAERGAVTPLRDAGFTKAQVRAASHRWGLPTWNKPAAACLSSRVAYGVQITPSRLARVDRAERALRRVLAAAAIPVANLRVRDLGDTARVEVDSELVERVSALPAAAAAVRDAGFAAVRIDPRGFRSGSMNELLADPTRYR